MSSEADKTFKLLSQLDDIDYKKLQDNNFKDFIEENKLADKTLIRFLEDVDIDSKSLERYQQYLKDTGNLTSTFTSFTQKASTALKSFGASLASIGINWAIGQIIGLAATAIDNFVNRVKYANEAMKDLYIEKEQPIYLITLFVYTKFYAQIIVF